MSSILTTGLEPRNFTWVIKGRLAISDRIGGHGFEHRRVRREEEILWLVEQAGINTVISLLPSLENITAYDNHGLNTVHQPVTGSIDHEDALQIYQHLTECLSDKEKVTLLHRETIDDSLAGMLGGYLIYSKKVDNPIMAAAVIQEILGRPLGREGRSLLSPPPAES